MQSLRSKGVSWRTFAVGCLWPALVCLAEPSLAGAPAEEDAQRIIVPAYFYPAGEGLAYWDQLIASAAQVRITAIVNPASGPGEKPDLNYLDVTRRCKKAGVQMVGYVSTRYGRRTPDQMQADIDRWLKFYPLIEGIFLDEQASSAEHLELYGTVYDYARKDKKLKLVISNPGTTCAEEFVQRPATDVVCLFEGPKDFLAARLPAWTEDYEPKRFAALAYDVPASRWKEHLTAARQKRFGWLFITDAAGANPWDRLPGYWQEEVAGLGAAAR